jgi:hypothetical protein
VDEDGDDESAASPRSSSTEVLHAVQYQSSLGMERRGGETQERCQPRSQPSHSIISCPIYTYVYVCMCVCVYVCVCVCVCVCVRVCV